MERIAAIAAVALALAGCAQNNIAPAASHTSSDIYRAVWQVWEGTDHPGERWIDTAATLVCKQIIRGIEPVVVPGHAANNEAVVSAAEDYVCEIDR